MYTSPPRVIKLVIRLQWQKQLSTYLYCRLFSPTLCRTGASSTLHDLVNISAILPFTVPSKIVFSSPSCPITCTIHTSLFLKIRLHRYGFANYTSHSTSPFHQCNSLHPSITSHFKGCDLSAHSFSDAQIRTVHEKDLFSEACLSH